MSNFFLGLPLLTRIWVAKLKIKRSHDTLQFKAIEYTCIATYFVVIADSDIGYKLAITI